MRAYQYSTSASLPDVPGAKIGIELVERETIAPGPGEVQVRVRASSLNFVDLNTLQGSFPVDGRIPLLDGAGDVTAVGDAVTHFKVGDRVVANPNFLWQAGVPTPETAVMVLGLTADGMLSETVTLAADTLVAVPETLDYAEAASLPCAGLSAWNSLMGGPPRYGISAGDTVLTQGTGGVSLFAVQFAKALDCKVIATTSSPEKASLLRSLGADEVINYVDQPDWEQQALALTGGAGVDLVVEIGGPTTLPQSIHAAKVGGRIAMVGIVGGMGAIDYRAMMPINYKILTLYANGMGNRQDLADMLAFCVKHNIRPHIDSRFAFAEADKAIAHFAARKHTGKVIIDHTLTA